MDCLPVGLLLGGAAGRLPACLSQPGVFRAAGSCLAQLDPPSYKWKERAPWQSKNNPRVLSAAQRQRRRRDSRVERGEMLHRQPST